MKVIAGKYPEEKNWNKWLKFNSGSQINRVQLYRLAAYIRDVVKKRTEIVVGLRSMKKQRELYDLYKSGKGNIAAFPGKSRHNYGLAVDFNRIKTVQGLGVYPGALNADYDNFMAGKKETLFQYGLRHSVNGEPWHIEPIETAGVSIDDIAWFSDVNDFVNTTTGYPQLELTEPFTKGNHVKFLQEKLMITNDGIFGGDTENAVKNYQTKNKLKSDGIAGTGTWTLLVKDIPVEEPGTNDLLIQIKDAEIIKLKAEIETLTDDKSELAETLDATKFVKQGLERQIIQFETANSRLQTSLNQEIEKVGILQIDLRGCNEALQEYNHLIDAIRLIKKV